MDLFAHIALLLFVAVGAWFLSAHGLRAVATRRTDYLWRAVRVIITVLLAEATIRVLDWDIGISGFAVYFAVIVPPLLFMWGGAITDVFSIAFSWLVDPDDSREFDPDKGRRDLDKVATLIREGRKEEAIKLCLSLKASGDASVASMDTILEQLGAPQISALSAKPINHAAHLRGEGRFGEAKLILKSQLFRDPANVEAAMLLMRIYAEDLHQGDKAHQVLDALKKQPHISAAHIDYAERSIKAWLSPPVQLDGEVQKPPESLEELLAQRYFGTAAERLQEQLREQPDNFELHMKLVELQCRHCDNVIGADKLIRQMELSGRFSREQMASARLRLKEWRSVPPGK